MKVLIVIPARYHSTRFPGKPLVSIGGKTMIRRVYEQVLNVRNADLICVATDDERIVEEVKSFGGMVMMTDPHHQSGTDRCAEVLSKLSGYEIIVNVQGDEPFIRPNQVEQLIEFMKGEKHHSIGTLIKRIENSDVLFNPNVVKVVRSLENKALYFSRSPIPYFRDMSMENWHTRASYFKHLGMYAFRKEALEKVAAMPASSLESTESLEQLRWLENGMSIGVCETDYEPLGIDTPEDLKAAEKKLREN